MVTATADTSDLDCRFGDEGWNEGNPDAIEEHLAADFIQLETPGHVANGPVELRGDLVGPMLEAFPDLVYTTEAVIADGDTVVTRGIVHGTNEDELMGIPPTRIKFGVDGIHIPRLEFGETAQQLVQGACG